MANIKVNEAGWDRILRIVVGAVLFIAGLFGQVSTVVGVILIVLGVVLLVTGIVGFCPLYSLLGFRTKK
jgi:Inner membrane protein YgaP-like, transmembrane domain